MNRLDSVDFVRLLRAGHASLFRHVETVNALNVFPVPDGDTGTNMELSLASGVKLLVAERGDKVGTAIQVLNRGLLMGARGNSGVILSQLFRGFMKLNLNQTSLSPLDFATAMHEGVQIAYKAVSKPVEGTILTVARESAQVAMREARHADAFDSWFQHVYQAAADTLEKTPTMLNVLREAGVVDSGGQGLVFIYEGFLRFLSGATNEDDMGPQRTDAPVKTVAGADVPSPLLGQSLHGTGDSSFGYCTEVLVRLRKGGTDVEPVFRETLEKYGDSMLVVQVDDLVKVHVHTEHPGRVLEDALAHGSLIQIKIENMTEQNAELRQAHQETLSSAAKVDEPVVIAVASGEGISQVFSGLGAACVVDGGATMNPSTEDLVNAIQNSGAREVILLPNHRNVRPSAVQAKEIVAANVFVLDTENFPAGIAAMVAYQPNRSLEQNVQAMNAAASQSVCGQVVRASREAVYQNHQIQAGQYLGMSGSDLLCVTENATDSAMTVVRSMVDGECELMTLFYGECVSEEMALELCSMIEAEFGLEIECKSGGQPIYDYIFSVE